MPKSKQQSITYIRNLMEDAGTYDPRFTAQIEDAADTRDYIDQVKKEIKKVGLLRTEIKTAGIDEKHVANPLLDTLLKFKKLYKDQLAALGLNYDGFKKVENRTAANDTAATTENGPTMEYFNAIR